MNETSIGGYLGALYLLAGALISKPVSLLWVAALLIKLGFDWRRAFLARHLLIEFQRKPATLQVGVAYPINAEEAVIIRQNDFSASFTQALNRLSKKQQQQWQQLTQQPTKGSWGDRKATGYDAVAMAKFIQINFPVDFVFVEVLLQQFSKPFYWPVQSKIDGVVFYFQKGRRRYHLLHNFSIAGTRNKNSMSWLARVFFRQKHQHI
ncbi:hypothetical protein [Loigolactobacillus binensis]|uniref:Uncharacterized protein n=1 Tax=Loigolactobacillus binensis TaxID=2559922 RepID=A0ABW3EAX1_9LACO|nr:hypothetical protein [Loigolactobacillus binensis]